MRILVFGAGALGSLMGGLLSRKHEVILVGRRAHVAAVRSEGLRITGRSDFVARPQAVEDVAGDARPELVLVTVKAYDTGAAAEALRPFWESALFLSLQNGLGNEELLASRADRVLGGVTTQGVTFVGPGVVRHAGVGETVVGPYRGTDRTDAEGVAAAFEAAGVPCRASNAIRQELWQKALVNACINPVTALLRAPNGILHRAEGLREVLTRVVDEGVAAAAAEGVTLDPGTVLGRVDEVVEATAENRSSMLQDLERGRRTEIEAINGAVVRVAEEAGLAAPVNRLLAVLVRAAETSGAGG